MSITNAEAQFASWAFSFYSMATDAEYQKSGLLRLSAMRRIVTLFLR
jgi:hypothetical protein